MISKQSLSSAAQAESYHFENGRGDSSSDRSEYYTEDGAAPSRWGGAGAAIAGLDAATEVGREDFREVLNGRLANPVTGEVQQLGRAAVSREESAAAVPLNDVGLEHRPGMDFTFAPPKSVSIAALVGQDKELVEVHERAVNTAMVFLEGYSQARESSGGVIERKDTHNLVWASFQHETSREQDPQLHTHVVIANATFDSQAGKWRALENRELLNHRTTADAIYMAELAHGARELGYKLEYSERGKSFELAGVSREQIEHFSQRTEAMHAALKERGIDPAQASYAARQAATLDTRDAKALTSREALHSSWADRAAAQGVDFQSLRGNETAAKTSTSSTSWAVVERAVRHLSERQAAFEQKSLVQEVARFSEGGHGWHALAGAMKSMREGGYLLERKDGMLTTAAGIAAEQEQQRLIDQGRGASPGVMASTRFSERLPGAEAALSKAVGAQIALKDEQRGAASLILTSDDRFMAVQGYAGTGKTTMLAAVRQMAVSEGWEIRGASVGGAQALKLEKESGIESSTVARLLGALERERKTMGAQGGARRPAGHQSAAAVGGRPNARASRELAATVGGLATGLRRKVAAVYGQVKAAILARVSRDQSPGINVAKLAAAGPAAAADAARGAGPVAGQAKRLLVVDEASMLSQKDMSRLMRLTTELGYKVAFLGDKAQHQSVEAGKAFELSQRQGIAVAELKDIQRQKDEPGRQAVAELVRGEKQGAFSKLDVHEFKEHRVAAQINNVGRSDPFAADQVRQAEREDGKALIASLAKDYVDAVQKISEGKSLSGGQAQREEAVLIVTGTNADRDSITAAVREQLKSRGLVGEGRQLETLQRLDMTEAQRTRAASYSRGDVLMAMGDYKSHGIEKGDLLRVQRTDVEGNRLFARNDRTGVVAMVQPNTMKRFEPFKAEVKEFLQGERIAFTRNDYDAGIRNGHTARIEAVGERSLTVKMDDGRRLSIDLEKTKTFGHGYASTTYKAQGETVTKTMVHINPNARNFGDRSLYVAITRATHGTKVYTTDRAKAADLVAQRKDNQAATESRREQSAKHSAGIEH